MQHPEVQSRQHVGYGPNVDEQAAPVVPRQDTLLIQGALGEQSLPHGRRDGALGVRYPVLGRGSQ